MADATLQRPQTEPLGGNSLGVICYQAACKEWGFDSLIAAPQGGVGTTCASSDPVHFCSGRCSTRQTTVQRFDSSGRPHTQYTVDGLVACSVLRFER